jgi:hypothetical protein
MRRWDGLVDAYLDAAQWQAPALFHSANWADVRESPKNVVLPLEATPVSRSAQVASST